MQITCKSCTLCSASRPFISCQNSDRKLKQKTNGRIPTAKTKPLDKRQTWRKSELRQFNACLFFSETFIGAYLFHCQNNLMSLTFLDWLILRNCPTLLFSSELITLSFSPDKTVLKCCQWLKKNNSNLKKYNLQLFKMSVTCHQWPLLSSCQVCLWFTRGRSPDMLDSW